MGEKERCYFPGIFILVCYERAEFFIGGYKSFFLEGCCSKSDELV